ncbi:MAG: phosphoenolpyruvate carboxykinase [GTP] [Gemmatales bacterium]|nr:MAG: phosphoenolpyruvate carboxykinase [GTP] [Gemmatales bacterium]
MASLSEQIPNRHVQRWVHDCAEKCSPASVRVLDGSPDEKQQLLAEAVANKVLIPLNRQKWPGCYLHRSHPQDVARTEHCTFICTPEKREAGPTNNWLDDRHAYAMLEAHFQGCMKGKTMFVVPFIMGPAGSPLAKVGIQLTDSIYVAISMGIMTRMGRQTWDQLGSTDDFTRCLHSVGDCDPKRRYICHFPHDNTIWSYGSNYGGNALLGKKCLALRIASFLGRKQGWMAEHMLLVGATNPQGETTYVTGAFPSACGKTNFAMMVPPADYRKAGWKISTVGDDIVWMYVNQRDGRLWAINPEAGYFGVVPGTSEKTNPNAMTAIRHDTIFTNVALLPDGDVWWEGKGDPPKECLDWRGEKWTPGCGRPAAHPNSRFTVSMWNNPILDPKADDPVGVPVSGIIFGGRRSDTIPLCVQSFNWSHGVYLGATLSSETTAAATGQVGVVRRDPMAMRPFCGYNMGDYFRHWLDMRKRLVDPPRIFLVNWFRKNEKGQYLWPGFGENLRVLEWMIGRCRGRASARETALGWSPTANDLNLGGLDLDAETWQRLQAVNAKEMQQELASQQELYDQLGDDMPRELVWQRELTAAAI